jgi:hypothetical protein
LGMDTGVLVALAAIGKTQAIINSNTRIQDPRRGFIRIITPPGRYTL